MSLGVVKSGNYIFSVSGIACDDNAIFFYLPMDCRCAGMAEHTVFYDSVEVAEKMLSNIFYDLADTGFCNLDCYLENGEVSLNGIFHKV